tara:strand:- start:291 stop:443 length:153 start_codon:yes stop_codon:yes gene_type:complete
MENFDKINTLNAKDRELISDLTSTFDLGTQTLMAQSDDDDDDLTDLKSEG